MIIGRGSTSGTPPTAVLTTKRPQLHVTSRTKRRQRVGEGVSDSCWNMSFAGQEETHASTYDTWGFGGDNSIIIGAEKKIKAQAVKPGIRGGRKSNSGTCQLEPGTRPRLIAAVIHLALFHQRSDPDCCCCRSLRLIFPPIRVSTHRWRRCREGEPPPPRPPRKHILVWKHINHHGTKRHQRGRRDLGRNCGTNPA